MEFQRRYLKGRARLAHDPSVCAENRDLFTEFFEWQEYKLKRRFGLTEPDEPCYKTLYGYILRLRNVNTWFNNQPWKDLTREEIKRVYDDLEDGRIRSQRGLPFEDLGGYYNKIIKGKPFKLAGKADLAREIIEVTAWRPKPVRYVTEDVFRTIADATLHPHHRFLLWLAWDVGENVGALVQLRKQDFTPQTNRDSGEREYVVRLDAHNLKRSRLARSEVTLYPETARCADEVLESLGPDDLVFSLGHASAAKFLRIAVTKVKATSLPNGDRVRWKDLRSGMACHLLRAGWTRDEVNARLGHTPRSAALDAYINFMALDRDAAKRKLFRPLPRVVPDHADKADPGSTAMRELRTTPQSPPPATTQPPSADLELLKSALSASLSQIEALRKDVARLSVERAA